MRVTVFSLVVVAALAPLAAQTSEWSSAEPLPRSAHSAVFDATSQKMIMFGGVAYPANTGQPNPSVALNDVWRLNTNLRWQDVKIRGTLPPARSGHSAVYDAVNNRMIVYGGGVPYTPQTFGDAWILTNASGADSGAPKWLPIAATNMPPERFAHGAAYDEVNNRMIIYGGDRCTESLCTVLGDVWVLANANGLGGTPTWTQLSPIGGGPGVRETPGSTAYDPNTNSLIVFGGTDGNGTMFDDVWVLSNANGLTGTPMWTQLAPTGSAPAARGLQTATYDPSANTLTVVGGMSASRTLLNDAWILTGANGVGLSSWNAVVLSGPAPEPRGGHSAVLDRNANRLLIFGGLTVNDFTVATNNTWALSHANGQ